MYCKNCGTEISETTKFCPNCGAESRTRRCIRCGKPLPYDAKYCAECGEIVPDASVTATPNWPYTQQDTQRIPPINIAPPKKKKKHPILGTIILIFGIFLIIGACSSGGEPHKVGSSESSAVVQPATKVFSIGDQVELNDVVVTLVGVTESTGGNYMTPDAGKVFLICEFNIENYSASDIAVSSFLCFEAYIDDYATTLDLSATVSSNKTQLDGTVAAGKKMNGIVGYSADKNWQELEIRFTPDFWSGSDIIFTYNK